MRCETKTWRDAVHIVRVTRATGVSLFGDHRLTFPHSKCEKVINLLHLIGENLDKTRAHYQAETGKIVQLMRGIYVDAGDDIDTTVMRHAVRIAHYLYPRAYLSGASAVLLAPTRDGRLFISGKRNQHTRIRALEIIQNVAPDQPATATAIIDDGAGEFRINVSAVRHRFLEAFRQRSEHAASIDDAMRMEIAARLTEEYGSPKNAADAVWALARENQWYREGEQAERYLLRTAVPVWWSVAAQWPPTPAARWRWVLGPGAV